MPNIYAGIAGMGLVQAAGVEAIQSHVRGLNERLLAGLDELGAAVATPRPEEQRGALVCVRSTDVSALVAALARGPDRRPPRAIPTSASPRTSTTSRRTSTALLAALARHRRLLA